MSMPLPTERPVTSVMPPPSPVSLPPPAPLTSGDIGDPRASDRSWFRRTYGPLVQAATWKATLHLVFNLGLGIVWFTIVVTMLSLSAGLFITLIGLPLMVATVRIGRVIGAVERKRVEVATGRTLPGFAPVAAHGGFFAKSFRLIGDSAGWRGLSYGAFDLAWGIFTFTATIVLWAVPAQLLAFPIYHWFIPDNGDSGPFRINAGYVFTGWGRVGVVVGSFVIGAVLAAVAPRAVRGLARIDHAIVRGWLSPGSAASLRQRVAQLTVSRDASVEGAGVELRRIERDLHDGAQQRLVGLAMELGLARDRLERGEDPARAAELVGRAHDEAKLAISELRQLVRGIHPQVLTDRGLDAALSALAARSPVPVEIDVLLDQRPPSAVEAAAYFVVAEALANIAKHSRARRATVRIVERGQSLMIEIYDDGVGGATELPGSGLSGLRDRVTAIEGRLRISSPDGGPTVLAVELPCGS